MNLPPFGSPPAEISMALDGTRPADFSGSDADWNAYFDTLVADIRDHIWPAWDVATNTWTGGAAANATEATRQELQIMIDRIQAPGVLDQLPSTPNYAGDAPPRDHYWNYAIEDFVGSDFIKGLIRRFPAKYPDLVPIEETITAFPSNNVAYYDETLDPADMGALFGHMFTHKYNGIYNTKLIFRRCRPQQAAYVLGLHDFVWRQAAANVHTGNHPALISGHCSQGLLFACTLADAKLSAGVAPGDIRLQDYKQYGVDFGDRRVFGAVHYPTDNIASWIAVLRLIPWVFADNGPFLRDMIKDALQNQSILYQIIQDTFPGSAELRPAWDILQAELAA